MLRDLSVVTHAHIIFVRYICVLHLWPLNYKQTSYQWGTVVYIINSMASYKYKYDPTTKINSTMVINQSK